MIGSIVVSPTATASSVSPVCNRVPGTVTIDPAKVPENATIEKTGYTLDAEPSADQEVKFRVELKIRTMRMLGTLKVRG